MDVLSTLAVKAAIRQAKGLARENLELLHDDALGLVLETLVTSAERVSAEMDARNLPREAPERRFQ